MFVFFLTCSVLVVSRKFPAVSSRDLKGRQGNARHRTFNSEFRSKRDLRLTKQVIPGSPSRNTGNPGSVIVPQYVPVKLQCLYGVKISS